MCEFLGRRCNHGLGRCILAEVKDVELSLAGVGYAVFSVAMLIMRLIGDKVGTIFRRGKSCSIRK